MERNDINKERMRIMGRALKVEKNMRQGKGIQKNRMTKGREREEREVEAIEAGPTERERRKKESRKRKSVEKHREKEKKAPIKKIAKRKKKELQ